MGEEDSVKNQDQEGYRLLREMLQSPVRDTVRARSLADLQAPDGLIRDEWAKLLKKARAQQGLSSQ